MSITRQRALGGGAIMYWTTWSACRPKICFSFMQSRMTMISRVVIYFGLMQYLEQTTLILEML